MMVLYARPERIRAKQSHTRQLQSLWPNLIPIWKEARVMDFGASSSLWTPAFWEPVLGPSWDLLCGSGLRFLFWPHRPEVPCFCY